jgi:hypothetical protein
MILDLIQSNLPELSPLIIGAIAFAIGVGFALRERAWRERQKAQGHDRWHEKAAEN